jgi:hypothetical protein
VRITVTGHRPSPDDAGIVNVTDRQRDKSSRHLKHGRQWFIPVIEEYVGLLALLRGEFDTAGAHLKTAIAGLAAADLRPGRHGRLARVACPAGTS